ncbi:uncharacterized protein LAESUDRAFT_713146 [Laetiporus sulphureus 93-53]|uniref:Uncharacterized protein n=1 Tax=Laetiporus sulphureus 93-53 TaxID=1314785 RepID=A0A165F2T9_9APHY|nr:uncharacterized protein LAESUDRAFT_713146 [Laetiporus sulphureus 93-53]KZT08255.1 hypothetical protein LAESUDRAFT_713146 [Laetiporus sulphureus 93-53]
MSTFHNERSPTQVMSLATVDHNPPLSIRRLHQPIQCTHVSLVCPQSNFEHIFWFLVTSLSSFVRTALSSRVLEDATRRRRRTLRGYANGRLDTDNRRIREMFIAHAQWRLQAVEGADIAPLGVEPSCAVEFCAVHTLLVGKETSEGTPTLMIPFRMSADLTAGFELHWKSGFEGRLAAFRGPPVRAPLSAAARTIIKQQLSGHRGAIRIETKADEPRPTSFVSARRDVRPGESQRYRRVNFEHAESEPQESRDAEARALSTLASSSDPKEEQCCYHNLLLLRAYSDFQSSLMTTAARSARRSGNTLV